MIASIVCISGTFAATSPAYLSYFGSSGYTQLYAFTFTFAISFGICNGLAYTIPLKVCWDHYPNRIGFVTGVIICGFGIGSFLFGLVSTLIINPNNLKTISIDMGSDQIYGKNVAGNALGALRTLALCWTVMIIIALFLI